MSLALHGPAFLTLTAVVAACAGPRNSDPVLPHESFALSSTAVGEERRINVYLPPVYAAGREDFPVLYMPDGGLHEDFPHLTNTVDELIRAGTLAPLIVVGIENTQRRRDLTSATRVESDRQIAPVVGGSEAFRSFVRDELIPEVERRYRTTGERAIVGESLAGLFVLETFLIEPSLFERYVALSPSLWWNDHDLVRRATELLATQDARPRRLWFTVADETDIAPLTDALAETLRAHAPATLDWSYEPMPDQQHSTIFRAAKRPALTAVLWQPR